MHKFFYINNKIILIHRHLKKEQNNEKILMTTRGKDKIKPTSVSRSRRLNKRKEKLYCICCTPYDDTK